MIVALLLVAVLVAGAVGFALGRAERDHDTRAEIVREHTRMLQAASKAHRRGHHGEANIYTEGAARLLELLEGGGTRELGGGGEAGSDGGDGAPRR